MTAQQNRKLLYQTIPAMVLPFFSTLVYFVFAEGQLAQGLYLVNKVFMIGWPLIVVFYFQKYRIEWGKIEWQKHLRAIPFGMLIGGSICAFGFGLYFLTPIGDYVRGLAPKVREQVEAHEVTAIYIPVCIYITFVHSLFEEYYWRWFVYGRLRILTKPLYANLLAGAAFAAHHYVMLWCYLDAFGAILFGTWVGLGGMIWAWMFQRQDSLVGCYVSHLLVDAGVLLIGYWLIF